MQRNSVAALNGLPFRFRRYSIGLLLTLVGLFQVAGASARPARLQAPRANVVRPAATIPDTSFTWVTNTAPGGAGLYGDQANDVVFLADGRVAATGTVEVSEGQHVFAVAVYGTDGELDWIRYVAGTAAQGNNTGTHIALDRTGNLTAVGYLTESVFQGEEYYYQRIFAISYTAEGMERWRRQITVPNSEGEFPSDLAIDSVGNVLIAGSTFNYDSGSDFFVAKLLGSDGVVAWQKAFDHEDGYDQAFGVTSVPSANAGEQDDVVAVGQIGLGEEGSQTIAYKIDGDFGAFNHWVEPLTRGGEPAFGVAYDVAVDAAGDLIVGGGTDTGFGPEFTVAKLSGVNGDTVWMHVKTGSSSGQEGFAAKVAVGGGGEVVAGGHVYGYLTGYDFYLTRLNPATGVPLWEDLVHDRSDDRVNDLAIDRAGNVAVASLFSVGDGGPSDFVSRLYSASGSLVWERTAYSSAEGGRGYAVGIAVDRDGNVAAAGNIEYSSTGRDFAVAYVDRLAPLFEMPSLAPTTLPSGGGSVLARVTVVDNVALETVEAVVTDPSGGETRYTLTSLEANPQIHERQITFAANATETPKVYKVLFTAMDTTGNVNNLLMGNVTVDPSDLTPPTIVECDLTPTGLPAEGGMVVVTAQVTDNIGVVNVEAVVTRPDESTFTVPMSIVGGDEYSGTISIPANESPVERKYGVEIRAFDGTNTSLEPCGIVTVEAADLEEPVIVSCQVNPPTLPYMGGTLNVSAVVTDNVRVATVTAIIDPPTGPAINVALVRGSGDNWSGTFHAVANTGTAPATYGVQIRAEDPSGNSVTEPCGSVTVDGRDITGPEIDNMEISPTSLPAGGGTVVIRARVTDASTVDSVRALIYRGSIPTNTRPRPRGGINPGQPEVVALTPIGNDVYEGTFAVPTNSSATAITYSVAVEASDAPGNSTVEVAGTFTVAGFTPGRLQLSTTLVNFGLVNLNNTAQRTFRIRNAGKGVLTGEMSLPAEPFRIFIKEGQTAVHPGGKGGGLYFALDSGEYLTVLVEFKPTVHGRYASEVRFTTDDPKKKKARVNLRGLGCRRR